MNTDNKPDEKMNKLIEEAAKKYAVVRCEHIRLPYEKRDRELDCEEHFDSGARWAMELMKKDSEVNLRIEGGLYNPKLGGFPMKEIYNSQTVNKALEQLADEVLDDRYSGKEEK